MNILNVSRTNDFFFQKYLQKKKTNLDTKKIKNKGKMKTWRAVSTRRAEM